MSYMPRPDNLRFVYRPKKGIGKWQVLTKTFGHSRWKRRELLDLGPAGIFATRQQLVEAWTAAYAIA